MATRTGVDKAMGEIPPADLAQEAGAKFVQKKDRACSTYPRRIRSVTAGGSTGYPRRFKAKPPAVRATRPGCSRPILAPAVQFFSRRR